MNLRECLVFIQRHIYFIRDYNMATNCIFYNTENKNLWGLGGQQITHQVGIKILIMIFFSTINCSVRNTKFRYFTCYYTELFNEWRWIWSTNGHDNPAPLISNVLNCWCALNGIQRQEKAFLWQIKQSEKLIGINHE